MITEYFAPGEFIGLKAQMSRCLDVILHPFDCNNGNLFMVYRTSLQTFGSLLTIEVIYCINAP